MTCDIEPRLLFRDMLGEQRNRYIHIHEQSTFSAMHMVVTIDTLVEAVGMIREREFLNQALLRKEVQGAIDRSIGNTGISPTDPFKNLAGGKMSL